MNDKIMNFIQILDRIINTNKSLFMKIISGIIIIIAILVIASCFNGEEKGNSSGNSYNSGLAVQDGKWIYYVEVDDNEPVGISKVKTNGKKKQKIADGYMYYLNIIDNNIYCLEYDEDKDQNNLIKIKTNGKEKEILARDIEEAQIIAIDKWIYYYKNQNLYRVKLNGTDRQKVSNKEIMYYQIEGNNIYYIYQNNNSQYIAKMKLDGTDSKRIAKIDTSETEEKYIALYVKAGKIYYITANEEYNKDYYLYKMNNKGENIEKICKIDDNILNVNMQQDAIYYIVAENYNSYKIKSIKYNGTAKETLKEEEMAGGISVTSDWIVYLGINEDYDDIMKMISLDGKKIEEL